MRAEWFQVDSLNCFFAIRKLSGNLLYAPWMQIFIYLEEKSILSSIFCWMPNNITRSQEYGNSMSGDSCASKLPFCQQFPFCLADVNNNESVLVYQRRIWDCSVFVFLDLILIFVCFLPLVLLLLSVVPKIRPDMQLPKSNFQARQLLIYSFWSTETQEI